MRAVRKFWRPLLLAFSLLISQQGALLHELRHVAESATSTSPSKSGKSDAPGTVCETCVAFAQIAGVIHSSVATPPVLAAVEHWLASEPFVAREADIPPHSARDPPIVL
jgi:hypothetical protein